MYNINCLSFFLRLRGTEIWYNSKRSKEPYDDKDKQHNQVLYKQQKIVEQKHE